MSPFVLLFPYIRRVY